MTISALSGSYAAQLNALRLSGLKTQLDGLTTQLSTGRTAETYGGLGSGRITALAAQGQIAALDGYAGGITAARTRVSLASASLTQVAKAASSVRTALVTNGYGGTEANLAAQGATARQQFAAALDALGQSTGSVYVFAGRATDTDPVADVDTILDGDKAAGLAGLGDVIAERKTADLAGGQGGITVAAASGTVTLSDPRGWQARANFGLSVTGVESSRAAAFSSSTTAGTAPSFTLGFAQAPQDGDTVRVSVNQADGSQRLIDFVARTTPTAGSDTEFAIGSGSAAGLNGKLAALGLTGSVAAVQSGPRPGASLATTSQGSSPARS